MIEYGYDIQLWARLPQFPLAFLAMKIKARGFRAKLGAPANPLLTVPVPLTLERQRVDSNLHPLHLSPLPSIPPSAPPSAPPTHLSHVTLLPPHPLQQFPVALADRVTSSKIAKADRHTHRRTEARTHASTHARLQTHSHHTQT